MKIAILGSGAYGTALGGVLAGNGYDIDYYDPQHEKEKLNKVVEGAKVIILCVPSEVAPRLLPHLPKDIPLVVTSKGFLSEKYFTDFKDWMVMSGPSFAKDMKAQKETFLTITDERLAEWFKANFIKFDRTEDRRGVLMCGALKNVYAILAGEFGLEPGTPAMKEFLWRASYEMGLILEENGAEQSTVQHACGLGDLTLTCGPGSRNYAFGLELRKNKGTKLEVTVEGVTALRRIRQGEIKIPESAQHLHQLIEDSKKWDL